MTLEIVVHQDGGTGCSRQTWTAKAPHSGQ